MDKKDQRDTKTPVVAPGIDDNPRGESATKADKEKRNITKVVNLIWDENDPS